MKSYIYAAVLNYNNTIFPILAQNFSESGLAITPSFILGRLTVRTYDQNVITTVYGLHQSNPFPEDCPDSTTTFETD
jgi:hypothetical protein